MERRELPGLDEVRAELSAEPDLSPSAAEPLELEEPGIWEDRRERGRARPPGLMERLGRLLRRGPDRS